MKPALAVLAIDATRVADASNTLIACRARQGQRPGRARRRRRGRRSDTCAGTSSPMPRGVRRSRWWTGTSESRSRSMRAGRRTTLPATPSARPGRGPSRSTSESAARSPSSPSSREAFPDAAILVTGVEDPDTRAHGANEGLHLAEFERVCLAEALLLTNLANLT